MKTHTRILSRLFITALLLMTGVCPLQANDLERERADLVRLIHELDFLIQETRAMGEKASPDPRITFDYPALASDLTLIRRRIRNHLEGVLALPNELPPLKGRYSIRGPGGY